MAKGGTVEYGVRFTVDQEGLKQLKRQLTDIRLEAAQANVTGNLTKGLKEAADAADKLEDILNSAWNTKLQQLDLNKVNLAIKNTYGSVQKLQQELVKSGQSGATAYNNFALSVLNTNLQLKQTSKTLDNMAVTLKNTIRYGISSSIFNNLTNSIQKAYNYTKQLDTSLNDIRIVTGKSAEEMDKFAIRANQVAKDLGRSTKDFTEASLIYYQQGLGNEEAQARAEVTMKAANVTGQAGKEVSEQLTAVWNGYKVTADEVELYVDKLAAVAATTASDLEELSTGMSKVASAANIMGVDIDQLNAQLATVVSVTKQAPESVGTAFKTIYARMGDIKAGLDDETTLGSYTSKMAELGFNVLDANGNLRDMGKVIEEIGENWKNLSREQQIALSRTMAGARQYNNLLSLFDNWDMYTEALETSANAAGTLQKQQDIYMESTEAHLQKLSAEAERTYDILFDQDTVNGFADALTGVLGIFNNLLAGLGGGTNDFIFFGSTVANIFNKQIGRSIERQIENIEAMKANLSRAELQKQIINTHAARGDGVINAEAVEKEIPYVEKTLELQKYLTEEQAKQFTEETAKIGLLEQQIQGITQYKDIAKEYGVEMGANSAETLENFKKQIEKTSQLQTEENKRFSSLKKNFAEYVEGTEHAFETTKSQEDITNDLIDDIEKMASYKNNEVEMSKITAKIAEGDKLSEEEINFILNKQRETRNEINNKVNALKVGEQGVADEEAGILVDLQNEQELREQNLQTMQEQVERQRVISELVRGMTALVSLMTSLSGIVKTLNDEDLTAGEKAERVVTVLVSMLPMLLMNLQSLGSLLPNIAKGTNILAVTMGAKGVTAASSFGASLMGVITVIGPYVLAIGAVVAAIYLLVKAYNKDADAAKDAAKSVETLTNRYNECVNAASELKNTISDYNNAIEEIKTLEKGTEEYTSALKKANEEAKKLIETYQLFGEYEWIDGAIKISDEALTRIQNKTEETQRQLASELAAAKIYANQTSLTSQTTDLARSIGSKIGTGRYDDYGHEYKREFSNDELTSVVDVLKNMEDIVLQDNEALKERLLTEESIPEVVKENLDLLFDKNGELIEDLENLTNATKDAAEANKYYAKQVMSTMISDKYSDKINELATGKNGEILEGRASQITEIATQWATSTTQQMNKALESIDLNKVGSNNKLNKFLEKQGADYSIDNDKDLALTYAEKVLGYDRSALTYKGGIGQGTVRDKTGTAIVDQVSDAVMRKEIAKVAATESIKKEFGNKLDEDQLLDTLGMAMEGARKFGEQYGTDFTDSLLNALTSKSHEFNLTSLYPYLDPNELNELQQMNDGTGEQWLERLGLSEEQLKGIGFSSAQEFAENFDKALENYQWSAKDAISASLNSSTEDFKGMGIDTDELSEYAEHIMNVADAADDLSDSLKYDSDSAIIVAKSVMRMNQGIEKLSKGYEDWTDILTKSEKSSKEYSDALNGMQDALADILDTEDDLISSSFVENHLEDIEKAANGDADAIDRLHKALAEQIVRDAATSFGLTNQEIDNLVDKLNNLEIPNIEVGAKLNIDELQTDYDSFLKTMGEIISAAGMTADEANALFSQMGFQANFATDEIPTEQEVPEYVTETIEDGSSYINVEQDDGTTRRRKMVRTRTRTYQDGTYKAKGKMTAIAMETSPDGSKIPKINSITKKAGGNYNNYSSKNAGGGGLKGGSSGGSSKQAKIIDPLDEEADRYHKVNTQITKIENSLKKLQSREEKLVGTKLIDNLNQQWEQLNNQIDNYNEKLGIAQQEQAELANELAGKGVKFNSDGTIGNYGEAFKAQENAVNSLINRYNSLSVAEQEAWDEAKTVDNAKEAFEKFKENLDRYDELVSDFIPGLEQEIFNAFDQQVEINIQKFNMEVGIALDMNQATRDWNEWKKKNIDKIKDEDILGNSKARLADLNTYFNEAGTGDIQTQTQHLNDLLEELKKYDENSANIYGDNRKQALEDLNEYYTKLMESINDVNDLQEEIHENVLEEMDAVQDKFDKQISSYELLRDLINHDLKVVQLVLGEDSYGEMAKFYEAQQENYEKQLDFQRQQQDFWKAQLEAAEEGSEEWDRAREKWEDAVQNFNNLLEEGLENATKKFENAINDIFDRLNNQVSNGLGLDYVNTEWDLINENADRYLDTINASYGIRELEKKFQDSINDTNNITVQQRLKKLMDEQITTLKQKDRLTQYDLDRANKLYEIELARIQLEEAQQNKSQMRLRRDSQGNYTYQYVGDQAAIQDAQDQLSNLYNDLYNFDKERYKTVLNDIYNTWDNYQQAMAEAALINDPEERARKEKLIQDEYNELMMQAEVDYQTAKYDLQESFFWDMIDLNRISAEEFQNLSQVEKDTITSEMVPIWTSGLAEMAEAFNGEDGFARQTMNSWDEIKEAENQYADDVKQLEIISGQTFDTIINGEDEATKMAEGLIKENQELINAYGEELEAVKQVYEVVKKLRTEYEAAEKAAIAAAEASYKYRHAEELEQIEAAKKQEQKQNAASAQEAVKPTTPTTTTTTTATTNSSSSGGDGVPRVGDLVDFVSGSYTADSYGGGGSGSVGRGGKVRITIVREDGRPRPIHIATTGGGALGWVSRGQISGYETGGYTGTWNNNGRLAVLHQKELVLNAKDTENMLNAVSIMRTLSDSLGSSVLARLAGATAQGYSNGSSSGGLEQNVHIDAQFPNVRDALEIEQALNNLVNVAAQRIYEK